MSDVTIHNEEVQKAKALLEEAGFRVSEAPIEWKDHALIVHIKVQSPDFTTRDFLNDVEGVLNELYDTKAKIQGRISRDIRGMSRVKVKMARVGEIKDDV